MCVFEGVSRRDHLSSARKPTYHIDSIEPTDVSQQQDDAQGTSECQAQQLSHVSRLAIFREFQRFDLQDSLLDYSKLHFALTISERSWQTKRRNVCCPWEETTVADQAQRLKGPVTFGNLPTFGNNLNLVPTVIIFIFNGCITLPPSPSISAILLKKQLQNYGVWAYCNPPSPREVGQLRTGRRGLLRPKVLR